MAETGNMAYSKIRQPKLSDVIEQQLEFLILEGTLRPGEKLPPERTGKTVRRFPSLAP
jgi:GntR family transcriptional repressor for pyruvate dehydrogenase complex